MAKAGRQAPYISKHTPKLRQQKLDKFLEYLAQGVSIAKSIKLTGCSQSLVYNERTSNPEYAKKWDEARCKGAYALEEEAWRRAVEGVPEDIYHRGQVVGTRINYSDTLLIFLLKGLFPERYSDKRHIFHDSKIPMQFSLGIERDDTDQDELLAQSNPQKVSSLQ